MSMRIRDSSEPNKKRARVLAKSVFLVYSQSGKLVTKMFQKVQELIDYKDALVFVLIDEVNTSAFIQHIPLPVLFFLLKGTYRKAPHNPVHRILSSNNDILQNNSIDHVTCRTPFILCSHMRVSLKSMHYTSLLFVTVD